MRPSRLSAGGFRSGAAALAFVGLLAWGGSVRAEGAPAVAASTAAVTSEEAVYVYNGASRDPFIPLTGGPAAEMSGVSSADKEPGAFNPSGMELKGILRTRTGRWAMLTGTGGDRYVVENGKIHDAKKKPVEGYVGIIKEKTLVLIGPNNQVTELKLKKDQEEQAKPK